MRKSIGIITICKTNNYGAELQAFATQKRLEQMGYDAEIIDYLYYKNWRFKDTVLSRPFIAQSVKEKFLYWLKYRFIGWIVDKILPVFNRNEKQRKRNYQSFIDNGCFSRQYKSMEELYHANTDYDIYIVGSDQVWNPLSSSSIEPYFLTFAPRNARKLAYASSFGISSLKPELTKRYATLLNNLDAISVREQSGVELVKQLTGRQAKLVVDPTLLLNKEGWMPYMKPIIGLTPQSYVLVYQLLPSQVLMDIALKIGQEKNLPVYCICKRSYVMEQRNGTINILDAGPSEFLWLISNAACVITNSFHGTAFSVNFATPFCCILNRERKNNGRMTSLLNRLSLENHILYEDKVAEFEVMSAFEAVKNEKLKELVKDSIDYLTKAINL